MKRYINYATWPKGELRSYDVKKIDPSGISVRCAEDWHGLHFNLAMMNHSCEPTAAVHYFRRVEPKWGVLFLRALTDLAEGDEVTFDYQANNEPMIVPFTCLCGAPTCRGRIE